MRSYLILLATASMLTACSSPKNTYYTLSAPDVSAITATTQKTRILVGPVTVPEILDTPQLVLTDSSNQVTIYEYRRWAGSLKSDIERVVAADLSRDLATPNVWSYTQSPFAHYDYQVFIDVQKMDSRLGDSVLLEVLWTIKPTHETSSPTEAKTAHAVKRKAGTPDKQQMTGRSVVREPVSGSGFEAVVAAQSRAFDRATLDIAKAIRTD